MTVLDNRPVRALDFPSGAFEVLPPDIDRDVWLDERRRSIGGSDASTLVGLNPYSSRVRLYLDKTGQLPGQGVTSAMEWGTLLEPVVREWLAHREDLSIVRVGMLRRPGLDTVHANLDGAVLNPLGAPVQAVEIKTSTWRLAHEWADDQVPDHAELQVQACLAVTGLPSAIVVGLIDGRDPQVRHVVADPDIGDRIVAEAEAFFRDFVSAGVMPALDDSERTNDALRAVYGKAVDGKAIEMTPELLQLFRDLDDAKEQEKAAKARVRLADSLLRVALTDAACVVDDLYLPATSDDSEAQVRTVYATAVSNGTFAAKAFRDAEPELAAAYTALLPQLDTERLRAELPDVYERYRARPIRTRKPLTELLHPSAKDPR